MGKNPSSFNKCGDDCPVEKVTWFDMAAFANALSEKEGLEACYKISKGEKGKKKSNKGSIVKATGIDAEP